MKKCILWTVVTAAVALSASGAQACGGRLKARIEARQASKCQSPCGSTCTQSYQPVRGTIRAVLPQQGCTSNSCPR